MQALHHIYGHETLMSHVHKYDVMEPGVAKSPSHFFLSTKQIDQK